MNWSIEAFFEILSSIPLLFAYFSVNKLSKIYQSKALRFMKYSWLGLSLNLLFVGIAFLTLNVWIYRLRLIFFMMSVLFMEYSLNLLEYDRVRPRRYAFATSLSSITVFSALFMDTVQKVSLSGGVPSLSFRYPTSLALYLMILWYAGSYLHFCYLLYRQSPPEYLDTTRLNFYIILVGEILIVGVIITGFNKVLPGFDAIILSVIVVVSINLLKKRPKLFFLLPQNPLKLFVIERESGNTIYSYDWATDMTFVPNQLFATALESIHIFVSESVKRGKLEEIRLEEASIIIRHHIDQNISFVLFAGTPSYIMKRAFESFIDQFMEEKDDLVTQGQAVMVSSTNKIDEMVKSVF